MFKSHFVFAIRLFLKERIYSVLNLMGITLGIGIGIILMLYLQSEFTYDQHYTKHEQIYRFTNHLKADGVDFNTALTARELAPILKTDLPEIEAYVRIQKYGWGETLVETRTEKNGSKQFYEDNIWSADSTMFRLFDHTFYGGNPKTCLTGPGKVVITKSIAEKYFGNENAVGKTLHFPEGDMRKITAVISDLPDNTHLKYTILLSDISKRHWIEIGDATRKSEGFWNPNLYTYLLFPRAYNTEVFYDKFPSIYDKTFALFGQKINGSAEPLLQPLASIHFSAGMEADQPLGNIHYVYTFAAIGLFIILLACINYMNMATARSITRIGEMGIRKALGFSRRALFGNVMFEAMLMAFGAMSIAILLTILILELTSFNSLIHKDLSLNLLQNPSLIIGILSITVLIGLISGIYPALYIPSVPVVTALKGTFTADRMGAFLRKGLIAFQFMISLFVIICTLFMDEQIDFMANKELGFDMDHVVLISTRDSITERNIPIIKEKLLQHPHILSAATAYGGPGLGTQGSVMWVEKDTAMVQQFMPILYIGKDYLKTMGLEIVQGRAFRPDSPNDYEHSLLINETGAREMGWGEHAIGKRARYFHQKTENHVIGVVKDFNFESLHNKITPLFISLSENNGGVLNIKISSENVSGTLDYIKEVWTSFDTRHPYEYAFLDQEFEKQYESDQTQALLISWLAYVCIMISLLGLVGLSAFTASRKAKEISIRKVLGANAFSIIRLFTKDYIQVIAIAFLIAVPIANYMITEWLNRFAYQMPINWWYFILPGVLVLTLGLSTVAIQSLRAARSNPVEGLRRD